MAEVKISELTKELEEVSKSVAIPVDEVVAPEAPEFKPEDKEKDEDEVVEAPEEKKEDKEPEDEKEEETVEEVVEKSDKEDKKDEKDKDKAKGKDKSDKKEDKKDKEKEDKEPVAKSAEALISNGELISAFESVVKSYGAVAESQNGLVERLERIEKSVLPMIENIAKHIEELKAKEVVETPAEKPKEEEEEVVEEDNTEDTKPEEKKEEVSKSMNEDLEGKGVEYVQKSADNVLVEDEEDAPEEEEVFKAADHVKEVVNYYTSGQASANEQYFLFGAVNRVKNGRETEEDVRAFRAIVGK
ncbi:hypothetical protein FP74_gp282 [Bacillus phage CAM003]|uniref:Uncharacterized protein n=2 Tax=Bastillevirus TaxID=1918010 RepID=A0A024B310_9CAUD|nr:hypothetical protein FP73_gp265 [Bacillus phage Hoody T]YP_009036980.1 hypothetical protein FP74_gp282 [Bacillus phage CAM003]AHZ09514.1 hypothetical protein [Bacillus phage CAM003]AHZ10388.1 hypothetical protein [Bacillus phage Hoody T]